MPFFGNVCFIKFVPFSALLALPVMIREEYGQMAHQTLPNILLSNASLVTKSYIARFVDDESTTHLSRARLVTAARVPLPRWRTESRPCRHSRPTPAVYGPAYLAAFAEFTNIRLIAVGKFERNVKYHLSMSSKLGFRVPRWSRNDTFLCAFVKSLLFFASPQDLCSRKRCQRQYELGPAPRRLGPRSVGVGGRGGEGEEGRPDLSNINTGASVVRSLKLSRLTKAQKRQHIYKCTHK